MKTDTIVKPVKISKSLLTRIDKLNVLINDCNKNYIYAIDFTSTWEAMYKFETIEIKGKFIYCKHKDIDTQKIYNERFNVNNNFQLDELKTFLTWILKAIKKGIKENK